MFRLMKYQHPADTMRAFPWFRCRSFVNKTCSFSTDFIIWDLHFALYSIRFYWFALIRTASWSLFLFLYTIQVPSNLTGFISEVVEGWSQKGNDMALGSMGTIAGQGSIDNHLGQLGRCQEIWQKADISCYWWFVRRFGWAKGKYKFF